MHIKACWLKYCEYNYSFSNFGYLISSRFFQFFFLGYNRKLAEGQPTADYSKKLAAGIKE